MPRKRSILKLMIWGSYKRPVIKIIFAVLLFLSSVLVGVVALYQFSSVQTKTVKYLASYLSGKIGMPITIENISINWLHDLILKNVKILDQKGEILIAADKIDARFNPLTIFKNNNITFNKVIVDQGDVRIVRHDSDGEFNIDLFVAAINNLSNRDTTSTSSGPRFIIRNAELHNSSFTLSDPFNDSLTDQFNYNQFRLKNVNGDLGRLEIYQGNFAVKIKNLSCIDSATQFPVNKLSCDYIISDTSMEFHSLDLYAGKSHVETDFKFKYKDQDDLRSFNDKVTIVADVKSSDIYSKDLGLFATYFRGEDRSYKLTGQFNGQISNFEAKNFNLQFGRITRIAGNLSMKGLPDFENTFIDLDVKNSILNPYDLSLYFPENTYQSIKRFGNSSFIGRFTGFANDFVAYASFFTQIGEMESDINFKINNKSNTAQYNGKLVTKDFDFGKLINKPGLFQLVDMSGYIKGKGLRLNDMDFNLNATISSLGINHYNFTGIKTDGRLTANIFDGFLSVNDPNLKFSSNANINLNKGFEKIKIDAKIDTSFLQPLGITDKFGFLSSDLNVNFNGLQIDSLRGYIEATNTKFRYGENKISLNKFHFNSSKTGSNRNVTLMTDDMDLKVSGDFNFTDVANDLPRILKEYEILLNNDSSEVAGYFNHLKKTDSTKYSLTYSLNLFNINPFLHLFYPEYSIADSSELSGSILGGSQSVINLKSDIDSVTYRNFTLLNSHLKINAAKVSGGQDVNLEMAFSSDSIMPQSGPGYNGLALNVNWQNQKINSRFKINQPENNNHIDLEATIDLFPSYTLFKLIPVKLQFLNETWDIAPSHYFIKKGKEFNIHDLLIYNQEQSVNIYGDISQDSSKMLNINVNNFKISNLNLILPKQFYGTANGYITVNGLYESPRINSRLFIDSLVIENFYAGDLRVSSIWNNNKSAFDMNLNVIKNKQRIINLTGNYFPLRKTDQLNLNASLNNANLNVLEPFYEDLVSDLKGNASGKFTITGRIDAPVLEGSANISNGGITIDYLKTSYTMDGKIVFKKNEIQIDELNLKDRYNNTGLINGSIQHQGFRNMTYKIKGTFKNLNLLNTSNKDNSEYYGTAYGTGNISLTGQNDNLNISVNAKSNSGTRLFIPLTGGEEVQHENFIQFGSLKNKSKVTEQVVESNNSISGIKLDFNLEVTPDTYCEIIFDPTLGEIIRGRGNGKLSLQIDTKGEFNMFGEYEITEGSYNFTLYNIINKAFTIQPGSTITWSGDPYAAQLDVTAEYRQLASLAPIFTPYISPTSSDSTFYQSPEMRRKYQTAVKLFLKGPLLSPEISFGIDIDYPQNLTVDNVSFSTIISAFENKIESNEQELKRQVFSLLVLRRFDEGSFGVSPSDIGSSVSEFFSNQLSYWVSQLDENLQVNLDLGAISQKALNTFQLTLSYSLAQGRLRITRAGNIYADQTNNDVSNFIGDWTLEYMLTPDGNLRAKMYNRFNYNTVTNPNFGTSTNSTGFSLMQTKGFNKFKELFINKKKKKKNERQYTQYNEGVLPSKPSVPESKNVPEK